MFQKLQGTRRISAFTFIEIMVVVVIIGIMVSVVAIRLVGQTSAAQVKAARASISSIDTALGAYEANQGGFPSTEEGLVLLVKKPADSADGDWSGPFLKEMPLDPWKQKFVYTCPGDDQKDYDLFSMGRDRKPGTDDDIWLSESRKAENN